MQEQTQIEQTSTPKDKLLAEARRIKRNYVSIGLGTIFFGGILVQSNLINTINSSNALLALPQQIPVVAAYQEAEKAFFALPSAPVTTPDFAVISTYSPILAETMKTNLASIAVARSSLESRLGNELRLLATDPAVDAFIQTRTEQRLRVKRAENLGYAGVFGFGIIGMGVLHYGLKKAHRLQDQAYNL